MKRVVKEVMKRQRPIHLVCVLLLAAWLPIGGAQAADTDLRSAAQALMGGGVTEAKASAARALDQEPNSRLAHWLRAQAFSALAGQPLSVSTEDQDLLEEARVRLEVAPAGMLPRNLVVMPSAFKGRHVPVLLADAARSRIYVFGSRQGLPVLLDEFYTSIGALGFDKREEGDRRTPLGVYRIRYEIRNPRQDGFLGQMAMTLDYPNAYDTMSGRTGSGIWIHGVSNALHVRPPKASDGCFALSNNDLQRLRRYVRYQETQVVVVPQVEWISPAEWLSRSKKAQETFKVAHPGNNFGVFYVAHDWPWVLSVPASGGLLREYWTQPPVGAVRRILQEPLS